MAKPKAKTKAKSKVKVKAKAKPAPKTKAKPKTKPKAKAKPAAKAKVKAKPKAKPEVMEQADLMRGDGMKVPSKAERAADVAASTGSPNYQKVRETILAAFRAFYPGEETDAEILEIDPNDFDMDPGPFYEMLGARFGLGNDPDNDYFGGFGGKIETTIANVAKRWDGKLR